MQKMDNLPETNNADSAVTVQEHLHQPLSLLTVNIPGKGDFGGQSRKTRNGQIRGVIFKKRTGETPFYRHAPAQHEKSTFSFRSFLSF